jgi:hypothetical protein
MGNVEMHERRAINRIRQAVRWLWRTDAPLTATAAVMVPVFIVSLAGMWLDPRSIGGVPAWLKPAKFAASIAIYSLTLACVFRYLPEWRRTRRGVSRITAATLLLEMTIIGAQAARGRASHFNVGTVLDGVLFSIMGAAIIIQTLASVTVAIALWRQRFTDRAMGWALRIGLVVTIAGAATGGLMTRPTAAQLEAATTTQLVMVGAHTVGAPDGGPGLPGIGWSTSAGDLRVPHFLGLHAIQALMIAAVAFRRSRRPQHVRVRGILAFAASYTGLFLLLLWQALRGESLVTLTAPTIAALVSWAAASSLALWFAGGGAMRTLTSSAVDGRLAVRDAMSARSSRVLHGRLTPARLAAADPRSRDVP